MKKLWQAILGLAPSLRRRPRTRSRGKERHKDEQSEECRPTRHEFVLHFSGRDFTLGAPPGDVKHTVSVSRHNATARARQVAHSAIPTTGGAARSASVCDDLEVCCGEGGAPRTWGQRSGAFYNHAYFTRRRNPIGLKLPFKRSRSRSATKASFSARKASAAAFGPGPKPVGCLPSKNPSCTTM